jgi:hypothetical protein
MAIGYRLTGSIETADGSGSGAPIYHSNSSNHQITKIQAGALALALDGLILIQASFYYSKRYELYEATNYELCAISHIRPNVYCTQQFWLENEKAELEDAHVCAHNACTTH